MVSQSPLKNRYVLHEKLGEGGMAEIYRATHILLDRDVAIKFIKAEKKDSEFAPRFQREAKAIARLNHPNILQVYDFDLADDGRYFMAMEYLPGGDLQAHFRQKLDQRQLFSLKDSANIIKSAAEGLHYAHESSVIHRDIKPSNIFIANTNRTVIGDFGIAKLLESDLTNTLSGSVMGTPGYLSPEQWDGRDVDRRTDIYGLGVVFFQLVTGRLPYESDTLTAMIAKHLYAPIPDPKELRADLPPLMTTITQRTLAKDPKHRYPTMQAFIKDLETLQKDLPEDSPTLLIMNTNPPATFIPSLQTPTAPLAAKTINVNLAFNYWTLIALIGMMVAVGIVAYLVLGQDDGNTPAADSNEVLPFESAKTGEYLIVVAALTDRETDINLTNRIQEQIMAGRVSGVLQDNLRLEILDDPITSEAIAIELGQAVNANIVVWGSSDASGWQVAVQAPDQPENTLQNLQINVLRQDDFEIALAEQVPHLVELYIKIMLIDDLIQKNDVFSAFYLTFTLDELDPSSHNLAATAFDKQVVALLDHTLKSEFFEADAAATETLRIAPNAASLYYLRWAANMLDGQRNLAERDIDRLADVTDDDGFSQGLRFTTYFLYGDMEALTQHSSELTFQPDSARTVASLFVYHAQVQQGAFAKTLADINAYRDWLQAQNAPNWQNNFLDNLVYVRLIQGDPAALEAMMPELQDWRDSRFYQEGNEFFRALQPDSYAPIAFSQGGYSEEVMGQADLARLTYAIGLSHYPDDYMLNWRQAHFDMESEDYQKAYDRYDTAVANAFVPFPIARYDQAVLVAEHEADLADFRTACDLLAEAHTLAETDTVFYQVLLERIATLQSEAGCSAAE